MSVIIESKSNLDTQYINNPFKDVKNQNEYIIFGFISINRFESLCDGQPQSLSQGRSEPVDRE